MVASHARNTDAIRQINQPQPVQVEATPEGMPRYVTRRRGLRRVTEVSDVWRVDDAWWREPISRRYDAVELEGGVDLVIVLDLVSGEWFERRY